MRNGIMDTPNMPAIGQYIKVLDWVGRIEDVAKSETRTMILVLSPKGIWLNHPTEWLEWDANRIEIASVNNILDEVSRRRYVIERMKDALDSFASDVER